MAKNRVKHVNTEGYSRGKTFFSGPTHTQEMAPPNRQKAFAQEELRNANLLRERGDILIQSNVDLAQAQGCYKKVR